MNDAVVVVNRTPCTLHDADSSVDATVSDNGRMRKQVAMSSLGVLFKQHVSGECPKLQTLIPSLVLCPGRGPMLRLGVERSAFLDARQ